MTIKAYKWLMIPGVEESNKVDMTCSCVRFVWNKHVESFNSYSQEGPNPIVTSKRLKDAPEYAFLNEVSAAALQQKDRDFIELKNQYFSKTRKSKIGRPKFKKRGVSKESFRLPNQKFSIDQENSTIRLEKIGTIKVVIDRNIPEDAVLKNVTVSKDSTGRYFCSILVDEKIELLPSTGRVIGIDLGLSDLMILSDGQKVENPRWFRDNQTKLAKAQRDLSRKQKKSKRYEKQKQKVARIHRKTTNQRDYAVHTITKFIVTNYDVIITESLSIQNMMKNRKLAKSIADAAWGKIVNCLTYKSNWYGRTFHQIDRFYPSSKTCSCCGHKVDKLPLSVREWTCTKCETIHNRDLNAAMNILTKGLDDLYGLSSAESVDYMRGETVNNLDGLNYPKTESMKRLIKTIY